MPSSILITKLHTPPLKAGLVGRQILLDRLTEGLDRKMTLISAPAGFGKSTLICAWLEQLQKTDLYIGAWLSLERDDNDLARFLTYMLAALRRTPQLSEEFGQEALDLIQSPQPPSPQNLLVPILNELADASGKIILILDDFHLIDSQKIQDVLVFLLDHLPPQLHLVIITRQDPLLPLGRLRAQGQLTEIRAVDLRFSVEEAAEYLNRIMGLELAEREIADLEAKTEGWIAGLHLAAISMRGRSDRSAFIKSFTGSNRLVLDYLVEDVLNLQSQSVQDFLLQTAILEKMNGSLCDALTGQKNGQEILERLEHENMFIIPLDEDRYWYRYHHLFAELLRQQLKKRAGPSLDAAALHIRASQWYEENGFPVEAFEHAAAAGDTELAERLMKGEGMPLQFRGAMGPVLSWFESLSPAELNARPSLWVTYAETSTMAGKPLDDIEDILQSAETALEDAQPDDPVRDLIGQIAAIRAMLVIPFHQVDTIITQAQRALEFLDPTNLSVRTTATWALGYGHQLKGDRPEAIKAHTRAFKHSRSSGNTMISIAAATSLGQIRESELQLHQAAEDFRNALEMAGDPPLPGACAALLGLANLSYEWNDLKAARKYGELSLQLAQAMDNIDTPVQCEIFFSRLNLAWGDGENAAQKAALAAKIVEENDFAHLIPYVAAAQVQVYLQAGDHIKAAEIAGEHNLRAAQARVLLAQKKYADAMSVLKSYRPQLEERNWKDLLLQVMVLQTLALQALGEDHKSLELLEEVLAITQPSGYIRTFVDEGPPMAKLLYQAHQQEIFPGYTQALLSAFPVLDTIPPQPAKMRSGKPLLIEPLSEREIEILALMAEGLTNQVIAERLIISPHTVKTHTRNIYAKLDVKNRTQAVGKSRTLGILPPL